MEAEDWGELALAEAEQRASLETTTPRFEWAERECACPSPDDCKWRHVARDVYVCLRCGKGVHLCGEQSCMLYRVCREGAVCPITAMVFSHSTEAMSSHAMIIASRGTVNPSAAVHLDSKVALESEDVRASAREVIVKAVSQQPEAERSWRDEVLTWTVAGIQKRADQRKPVSFVHCLEQGYVVAYKKVPRGGVVPPRRLSLEGRTEQLVEALCAFEGFLSKMTPRRRRLPHATRVRRAVASLLILWRGSTLTRALRPRAELAFPKHIFSLPRLSKIVKNVKGELREAFDKASKAEKSSFERTIEQLLDGAPPREMNAHVG
jgi:hypothetical protein